ncbi:MAG: secondary thiamine-phosphate synthase enzyme YjbQ [Dictyoglomaceae bacterium]|nr:secondary thiamine-phosphate synthase enzyme YjbQ [Dictyoglomaceae bacterium]
MFFEFTVSTPSKTVLVDITEKIEDCIRKSNIKEGRCFIFIPHTTAGIIINENYDPSVVRDILNTLEKLIPWSMSYSHAEGNAPAHIKSTILGNQTVAFIQNGRLKLGTWQGIFLAEFDGPRVRKVWVDIMGE